jgi:signal transduction histidine kinase
MALFKKRRRSLSARLVILFVVMAILFLVIVGGSLKFAFQSAFKENIGPHLLQYMNYIQKDIGTPPNFERAKEIVATLPVEIHLFDHGRNWSSTGSPLALESIDYHKRFSKDGVDYSFGDYEGREYLVRKHKDYTLAFSVPRPNRGWSWRKAVPLTMSLIFLMILYHLTKRIFAPIKTIKSGIEKIGEGDLQHRIEINTCDEFGDLSNSINKMADDIQQMLEAKRQLLLAISHELRTPMTRAKVSLEMLDDEKKREAINKELNEMDNLISELLETERLKTGPNVLNKTNVSLNELAQSVVDENFKDQKLALEFPNAVSTADVDVARIKLLLKNLLENALRHNSDDAQPPTLTLEKSENGITFKVQNFGQAIEAKHIPYLTEPFYRVDPARQRQTGGYGLGLYLCRIIAEAHGGQLHIFSKEQEGTTVIIQLSF